MTDRLADITAKMERIVSAIYIATQHIEDRVEIKHVIRLSSISVMAGMIELVGDALEYNAKVKVIKVIKVKIYQTMSFIKVLLSDKIISDINAELLIMSYNKMLSFINNYNLNDMSDIEEGIRGIEYGVDASRGEASRSGEGVRLGGSMRSGEGVNLRSSKVLNLNGDKIDRKSRILSIIRDRGESGCNMSDLLSQIKDISEKTMQRELIVLIASGHIQKVGEKRWSRYILSHSPPSSVIKT